jgi:predicted nucleic acid-binding protein
MLQGFQKDNAVITDTSCFILLDKIGALAILQQLYRNIITTPETAAEFGEALPAWVQIKSVTNRNLLHTYAEKIDLGEASAIVLSLEIPLALLILDDLKGRKLAQQLNLNHTGTLGILILARQQNIIPLLKPYFDAIKATNFRVSHQLLESILEAHSE